MNDNVDLQTLRNLADEIIQQITEINMIEVLGFYAQGGSVLFYVKYRTCMEIVMRELLNLLINNENATMFCWPMPLTAAKVSKLAFN